MSAPPDSRPAPHPAQPPRTPNMSQNQEPSEHGSNVRHIPIFVEGRDEPVINKGANNANFAEPKPAPHIDRDQYFADDAPTFHAPQNFSRAFGTPFNKGFRQGPQPFVQQKAYPQTAFTRGASPGRPEPAPHHEEPFVKVPVHHDQASRPAQKSPHQAPPAQAHQPPPPPPPQPHAASPPPRQQPVPNDPITQILSIQTDVLNLMSEVENFTGIKTDKRYIYLDEMLTRNLIKLDNIETDGKENIRTARKEAIRCIQKCIAVLEAKAEGNRVTVAEKEAPATQGNGEAPPEEPAKDEPQAVAQEQAQAPTNEPEQTQAANEVEEPKSEENKEASQPQAADTRPEETRAVLVDKPAADATKPKKSTKVKKRDKSKDNRDSNNEEKVEENKLESEPVDDKGDKGQPMEVDGAAASQ